MSGARKLVSKYHTSDRLIPHLSQEVNTPFAPMWHSGPKCSKAVKREWSCGFIRALHARYRPPMARDNHSFTLFNLMEYFAEMRLGLGQGIGCHNCVPYMTIIVVILKIGSASVND
jgi:hypothetical protein